MKLRRLLHAAMLSVALVNLATAEDAPKASYVAKAVVQYRGDSKADVERLLTDNLPRGEASAAVHRIRTTPLFEVTVTAPDAKLAVTRVNQIVLALQKLLSDPDSDRPALQIMTKGEVVEGSVSY